LFSWITLFFFFSTLFWKNTQGVFFGTVSTYRENLKEQGVSPFFSKLGGGFAAGVTGECSKNDCFNYHQLFIPSILHTLTISWTPFLIFWKHVFLK